MTYTYIMCKTCNNFRNGTEVTNYGKGLYSSELEARRAVEIIRSLTEWTPNVLFFLTLFKTDPFTSFIQ